MADILDKLTPEEISEYVNGEKRLAEHAILARMMDPAYYDQQGEFVPWLDRLSRDKNGSPEKTLANLCAILETDPELAGIGYDQLQCVFAVTAPLPWRREPGPWRDADDAQLMRYVDERYCHFPISLYLPALQGLADLRGFHPVRQYLEGLAPWDGVPRVDTLLADCLGAEDSPYVRAVTRKTLCAAVRRVLTPGTKFDQILVLAGPQGIGKSTLIARLGRRWFTDSLTISDMNDKTGAEKLQGYWLVEIGEMAGMKKTEVEKVKSFLSREDDKFRASYGRRVTPHPRQCVFFGTTNEEGYLRDVTGNRRFWTVAVSGRGRQKPWQLREEELDQIWAEARLLARTEPLFLDETLEPAAAEIQRQALERDDREGLVRAYLDKPIPVNWESRSLADRVKWYQLPTLCAGERVPVRRRDRVSNLELWCECFGNLKQDLNRQESAALAAIMARIEGWEKAGYAELRGPYGSQRIYRRRAGEKAHTNIQHTMT